MVKNAVGPILNAYNPSMMNLTIFFIFDLQLPCIHRWLNGFPSGALKALKNGTGESESPPALSLSAHSSNLTVLIPAVASYQYQYQ